MKFINHKGPANVHSAFDLVGIKNWGMVTKGGQKNNLVGLDRKHQLTGVVIDQDGDVVKGHNKFPESVCFQDNIPHVGRRIHVVDRFQTQYFYDLLREHKEHSVPWMGISPFSSEHEVEMFHFNVSAVFDLNNNVLGGDIAMGKAVVSAPKELYPDDVFATLSGIKQENLSFRLLQVFKQALNPNSLGFRIKKIEVYQWSLSPSDMLQVIIHPGKEIK